MQGFKVSVAEILGQPGHYRDISVSEPIPEVGNALAHVTDAPLQGRLRAEAVVEGVLVTGTVTATIEAECARCLTPVSDEISVELCELFVAPGHDLPDEEDAYEVEGFDIDLEPMLRDALALDIPLRPVCRADCKGLCARCGKDLNEGACSCEESEMDPRWAALSEMRDKLG
ncbi:MAG: YceD family protein [Actinomycetota bacterium]